ncbi:MAG: dienelactone hydrolase family protein, partial [Pseudomonadales bacterium]
MFQIHVTTEERKMRSENIEYSHKGATLEGFFAYDDASEAKRSGVVICHAWGGRDDFVIDKAHKLAARGYAAFALDMFGKGVLGSGPEENQKLIQPFVEDRALLRDRMLAGLMTLANQSIVDADRIAAIGFC